MNLLLLLLTREPSRDANENERERGREGEAILAVIKEAVYCSLGIIKTSSIISRRRRLRCCFVCLLDSLLSLPPTRNSDEIVQLMRHEKFLRATSSLARLQGEKSLTFESLLCHIHFFYDHRDRKVCVVLVFLDRFHGFFSFLGREEKSRRRRSSVEMCESKVKRKSLLREDLRLRTREEKKNV